MMLAARRALRLRFRDLAAASAFVSVALSGALPVWALAIFSAALGASLLGWRPLGERPVLSGVALLVSALGLFGLVWLGRLDLLVAAGIFATLVTAQRLVSSASRQTDHQVLLAALLLLAGGAALSGEIWYAACLFAFGLCACLALGLGVIEGPEEIDGELPVAPLVRQMLWGVAFAVVGAIVFFVAFPRLSWNVAARRVPPSVLGGNAGMSDRVRLGGQGTLKTSARVVARITLQPDPGVDQLDQYWVGRSFDAFDGREWRGTGTPGPSNWRVQVARLGRGHIVQRVELLPAYEARTLLALDVPLSFEQAVGQTTNGSGPVMLEEVPGEEVRFGSPANAYRYVAHSRAPDDRPPPAEIEPERYLALPERLDPRVRALAGRITAGATSDRDKAARLEAALKRDFEYTLELDGDGEDPLADFLFVHKRGHCEHFASALAVLLRASGVPARVTAGFYGGERVNDLYVLRAGDAHAWTQAWLPGEGWVGFDATPDAGRTVQRGGLLTRLTEVYEQLEEAWRRKVVDYTLWDQVAAVRTLVRPPREAASRDEPVSLPPLRRWGLAFLAAVMVFVALRLALRPRAAKPHPAATFLDALELRLREAGVARREHEPVEELAARLRDEAHPLAQAVALATRRYVEARFGQRPFAEGERQALLLAIEPPARR